MRVEEIKKLDKNHVIDLQTLMGELIHGCEIAHGKIKEAVETPDSHVFGAIDETGHIQGCAVLCVYTILTGKQAVVENVVVNPSCRGKHVGRMLMEYLIDFVTTAYGHIDIHLTSNPKRVAANNLYRSLGFQQRETNVYKLAIRQ